ncbi:MAG: DNA-binding transcriptional regulator [Gemmatimonadaceae bacterium]|nr:DNA-binding transcriptional regulator [Gemmatimonadaceae bacterium]
MAKTSVKTARAEGDAKKGSKPARRVYKSDAFEAIHSAASDLYDAGLVSPQTMREFDASCLAPPPMSPAAIKRLRHKLGVSQPVFAAYLNTTPSTVMQWESGAKRPGGMGLRLLQIADKKGLAGLE